MAEWWQIDPRLAETPSQTAGPYVHIGLAPQAIGRNGPAGMPGAEAATAAGEPFSGPPITVEGTVYDGAGVPVTDCVVETWQADGDGRLGPHGLFARAAADFATGRFALTTVKPGVHAPGHAPHVAVLVFARGINIHLHTRLYFEEDRALILADPDLARLPPPLRETLIARPVAGAPGRHRFDIRLQGPDETVFFDI